MSATNEPKSIQAVRWRCRYTLRGLLLFVAFVAVVCAALINASSTWVMIVSTATFAIFLASLIVCVFGSGRRRSFAGGFAICGIAHLALVYLVLKHENNTMGRIGTTTLLRYLHMSIATEVPNPNFTGNPGWAVGPATVQVPLHDYFMQIGQQFWALIIGWLGGLFACYVHGYRRPESRDQPVRE